MIATYLDTSAILRLCTGEGELGPVEEAMAGLPVTSVVAEIEMAAAIHARFHRGAVDEADRARLLTLGSEILDCIVRVVISAAARREAVATVAQHLLRALAALHIGTAATVIRVQRRRGNSLRFCTADRRQAAAAIARFGATNVILLSGVSGAA